ncbi:IucA/IucC family protein [Paenibacillus sp. strain BS8-2]
MDKSSITRTAASECGVPTDIRVSVQRRVVRQLCEALLFEDILKPSEQLRLGNGQTRYVLTGLDNRGLIVRYECIGIERFTFQRIRLVGGITRVTQEGATAEALDPATLLRECLAGDHTSLQYAERMDDFVVELEHTILNDALAQTARRQAGLLLRDMEDDVELEAALADGHPYHPSYKSRIGFTEADQLAYGPEFAPDIYPIWVAVARMDAGIAISSREDAGLNVVISERERNQLDRVMQDKGLTTDEYVYVPVHPWQWENRVLPAFSSLIRENRIVKLAPAEQAYRPQQSIRTLLNQTHRCGPSLKLSLGIRTTSSYRELKPPTTVSAPLMSDWLSAIAASDSYLRDEARVVLLREFAGVACEPADAPELAGIIGCIWRESPFLYSEPGERVIPFTALTAIDLDGEPYIHRWIEDYGLQNWLQRLLEKAMLPVLHLLVVHGIALEAHAQNMAIIVQEGLPRRVVLKDFHESLEFCTDWLANPDDRPPYESLHPAYANAAPNAFYEMDGQEWLRELVVDAFFHMNLGELTLLLQSNYGFEERQFWRLALEIMESHMSRDLVWRDRYERFALLGPSVKLESLAKRRLVRDMDELTHEVANPLHCRQ